MLLRLLPDDPPGDAELRMKKPLHRPHKPCSYILKPRQVPSETAETRPKPSTPLLQSNPNALNPAKPGYTPKPPNPKAQKPLSPQRGDLFCRKPRKGRVQDFPFVSPGPRGLRRRLQKESRPHFWGGGRRVQVSGFEGLRFLRVWALGVGFWQSSTILQQVCTGSGHPSMPQSMHASAKHAHA